MDRFEYRSGQLWCEGVPAIDLARRFDTPLYVYSRETLLGHYERVRNAFAELDPLICFSIKSCQNVHILRLLHEAGSGFDVVSGGELFRALHVGADPARIVFAGVGKTSDEINAGTTIGPRMQVAGYYLTIPGGGGDLGELDVGRGQRLVGWHASRPFTAQP